jgi:hypothetical protein
MQNQLRFFDYGAKRNVQSDDMDAISSAMSGDIIATISPATLSTAHASAATRIVSVTLTNTNGQVHTWCNETISAIVTSSKSSVSGTASTPSANIVFVNGVATITQTIGGTWLAADTDTITIANIPLTFINKTVTGGTSVETMS